MKKTCIAIFVAILTISVLTLCVFAADPIAAINNVDTQLRDGVSKIVGLAGVVGAGIVFWSTKKWIYALGTLAGGALIAYLISNPGVIGGIVEGVASWLKL